MKKFIIFLGVLLLLSGCGKYDDKDLVKDLSKKLESSKAYHMTGTLEIYRNEEKYTYSVNSSYKTGDLFKVDLVNQNNNHEQIILKNSEGVYVLTPSLNKSFKFQSDWPYNNSQIYLLQPIISDVKNDDNREFEETSDGYIITSKVNYSSERDYEKQKIYVDKEKNITKVEVVDNDDNVKMSLIVIDIDYKAKFDDEHFSVEKYQINTNDQTTTKKENANSTNETSDENRSNIEQNSSSERDANNQQNSQSSNSEASSTIEDIVYPMYVPIDTQLSGQDVIETASGERVILTFSGESAFTVVQETLATTDSINYIYGDPYLILDTIGAITDYSVSWISNGIEYSVMSDTMDIDELLTVAQSISVKAVAK